MYHKPSEHKSNKQFVNNADLNRQFLNNTGLHQLKHSKDQMEAYNTKQSLISFRKKLLDDQKKNNYSMEYDRIRGILAHSNVMPFKTQASLMNRRDELKKMGAQALGFN
jgi:hypothetical protein